MKFLFQKLHIKVLKSLKELDLLLGMALEA